LASGDKKEKVQKVTLGFDSKGDQHEFILSQRGFVGISFYSQAAEEISDNEEPHEPLFSGKAANEQALGPAQCILEKKDVLAVRACCQARQPEEDIVAFYQSYCTETPPLPGKG
jgi:hypothetical protein